MPAFADAGGCDRNSHLGEACWTMSMCAGNKSSRSLIMINKVGVRKQLDNSFALWNWIANRLDGLKIRDLPQDQRLQLAMSCQHLASEHAQAIIVLMNNELCGSAFALQRPMFEAILRGVWLRYSATQEEIEELVSRGFPTTEQMAVNSPRLEDGSTISPLKVIKDQWWNELCGYTHGGSQQILARLSSAGLQSNFGEGELAAALRWSEVAQLFSGVELADAACNESIARELLERLATYDVRSRSSGDSTIEDQ